MRHVPDPYEDAIQQGVVLRVEAELVPPDSAFVMGALAERGVTLQTAVCEALVDWAAR